MLALLIWAVALVGIVYFNARFWQLYPDKEDLQHRELKRQNKPSINPILKDTWHAVKVFLSIGVIMAVAYGIYWIVNN